MKTILLIFIVSFIFSPEVRNITSNTLHTAADIIQNDGN